MAEKEKVIKYRKPLNFNLGLVIFIIIIIYVVFNVFSYLTKSTIAEYQVCQGSIMSNNIYRGLIIRDETVINSQQSGYINYYIKNGSKVSVNDVVYSVDTSGKIADQINNAGASGTLLTESSLKEVSADLDNFVSNYNSSRFSYASTFKSDLNSELTQQINSLAMKQLNDQILSAEAANTFYRYVSGDQGIVAYYLDGYESATIENFSPQLLDASGYSKTNLESNSSISQGSPVYKLVNSDKWYLLISINDELAEKLSEKSYVKIRFCQDDFSMNASCEIRELDGQHILILSMRNAMIRYLNERFVDIELVVSDTIGLKIPKSAIVEKEFFTVPKKYFLSSGSGDSYSLILADVGNEGSAVSPTIYFEKDEKYYIDSESVSQGTLIRLPDSLSGTYTIGTDTATLKGVYNINKGYAIFKQIDVKYDNDEYAIVEPKTKYGISLYDHIALDGSKLKEDQLINK